MNQKMRKEEASGRLGRKRESDGMGERRGIGGAPGRQGGRKKEGEHIFASYPGTVTDQNTEKRKRKERESSGGRNRRNS